MFKTIITYSNNSKITTTILPSGIKVVTKEEIKEKEVQPRIYTNERSYGKSRVNLIH